MFGVLKCEKCGSSDIKIKDTEDMTTWANHRTQVKNTDYPTYPPVF